jgi:ribonuclease-3
LENAVNVDIGLLERKLGHVFRNKDLLWQALTHRGYIVENPQWPHASNKHLELFGDAIVYFLVMKALRQMYPVEKTVKLSTVRSLLVSNRVFAEVGERLELHKYLRLDRSLLHVRKGGGSSVVADCFEAVVAAIYDDAGEEASERFLSTHLFPLIPRMRATPPRPSRTKASQEETAVTTLLGRCLKRYALAPRYSLVPTDPGDKGEVTVAVFLNERRIGEGKGKTRQLACIKAAENALARIPPR